MRRHVIIGRFGEDDVSRFRNALGEAVARDDNRAFKLVKYIEKRRLKNRGRWEEPGIKYKPKAGNADDRYVIPAGVVNNRLEKEKISKSVHNIPIHKLTTRQEGTDWDAPDDVIKKKLNDKEPIDVIKHPTKDEYHIWDGHHRYDAHRIKGKKTIKAYVANVDDVAKKRTLDERRRSDDQILNFVKKLNRRSEKTGIKNSGDGTFKFSHKYKDWPEKKEPDDIYDYDLAGAMNKAKKSPPKRVSLKGIVHTQPGVGFHAPEDVIKQKVQDDSPIEVVKHKGKKYLWDGHHRDFIARIRGDRMAKAHVVDTSKLEKRA